MNNEYTTNYSYSYSFFRFFKQQYLNFPKKVNWDLGTIIFKFEWSISYLLTTYTIHLWLCVSKPDKQVPNTSFNILSVFFYLFTLNHTHMIMLTSYQCNKIRYSRFRKGHPGLFNKSDGSANTKNPIDSPSIIFLSTFMYCCNVIISRFPSSLGNIPKKPLCSILRFLKPETNKSN